MVSACTTVWYLLPTGESVEETHLTADVDVREGKSITIRTANEITLIPWRRVLMLRRTLSI